MSTIIMSKCWPLQMGSTAKSVLISLADNANDDGYCWPSIAKIAKRTCFSERAVQNAIKWLEEHKLVKANRENGRHTTYVVTPEAYTPPQEMHPAANASTPAGGASHPRSKCATPPQEVPTNHHITVIEPSIEPSLANADALPVPGIAEESTDPVVFAFPLNDKTTYGLRVSQIAQFVSLYPSVEVDRELRSCLGWNIANEAKRKTRKGILNHINNWLAAKQNNPGYQPAQPPATMARPAKFDPVAHVNRNRIRGNP